MSLASQPLLICRIASGRIAIPAPAVAAILPVLPLWRPPTLPRPLLGFATIMGTACPVLSPDMLFDEAAVPRAIDLSAHLVRLRGVGPRELCLLVARAEDMVTPVEGDIRTIAPGDAHNACVLAEVMIGETVAHLIAVDRLLGEAERVKLEALTRIAEHRAGEWA